jgi:spermidine synthase
LNTTVSVRGAVGALVAFGATAIATQIVLIREFLSVFYGNELIVGIVLAVWMILTGFGAFLGRTADRFAAKKSAIPVALLAIGIMPLLTVFLLRLLRNQVFTAGGMIGIAPASLSAIVALAPFCCISGFSFALFTTALSRSREGNPTATAYSWESLGSAGGGLLFSLLVFPRLETFQGLTILFTVDVGLACVLDFGNRSRFVRVLGAFGLAGGILVSGFGNLDRVSRQFLFPRQTIAFFRDTPYGNLTVTRQDSQVNVFENSVLMFSTNDITANEENVHYAMAQHPSPRRVLLIGGGISGTTLEVLKYGVEDLDYAEMNPWIIDIGRRFTRALDDRRIHVINDDGRKYVRTTDRRYDVALINLPDPETIQLNRFYTTEFFGALKRVLNDSAVVSITLLPAAEYQGPEARSTSSVLYATLRRTFANVLIVPGARNYFLATDGGLDIRIGRLIDARKVATTYVNRFYLDDRMLERRSREITQSLERSSPINSDFEPVSYFRQLAYWLSYFGMPPGALMFLAVAAILLLMWRFSGVGVGMFVGGMVGVSLEIILLLVFQTLSGALYSMTGILVTAFMTGLAAGSWLPRRFFPTAGLRMFVGVQLGVAAICVLLPVLFVELKEMHFSSEGVQAVFSLLAFLLGVLFGMEFAVAASIRRRTDASTASELYGLDLAGAGLGALAVSIYAIPLFGVIRSSVLLGLVSAAAAIFCLTMANRDFVRG